jgi:LEA14-like dessication related protein
MISRTLSPARRALTAAALLAAAGSGACSEVADAVFTPPRATLRGVAFGALGTNGPGLDVVLLLENPNPYALTATRTRYRLLTADSSEIGSGALDERVTVAANDSATVTLPVSLSWSALGGAGQELLRGGDVDLRLLGEVTVETPVGERTIPLEARRSVRGVRR